MLCPRTLLAIVLAGAALIEATVATADAAGYRFVERPIVTYHLRTDGSPEYTIYARLNRALPRVSGRLRGAIRLEGFGLQQLSDDVDGVDVSAGFFSSGNVKGRHCYRQVISSAYFPNFPPPGLSRPQRGWLVSISMLIGGRGQPLTTGVRMRRQGNDPNAPLRYERELGCYRSPRS